MTIIDYDYYDNDTIVDYVMTKVKTTTRKSELSIDTP